MEKYNTPEIEVVAFDADDIIATSDGPPVGPPIQL